MPLRDGARRLYKEFRRGVSYKSGDIGDKLIDAQNMLIIQNKLQTRPGLKKFTSAAFSEDPQSLSYYKNSDATVAKILAKTGTTMQATNKDSGVFSEIKSGLSTSNIHDAVTFLGRHIIAIGSDGLFSYDGTDFAELGVDVPTAPTIAADDGTGTLTDKTYEVAITYECSSTGFETNIGAASNQVATSGGNDSLDVTAIPVSTHPLVTHKNIYIKNVSDSGAYLFVAQIANATTTHSITENPSAASENPPTGKDKPLAGGAKYLAIYNGQIVSAGNTNFQSDVFFSNADEPDAWSTDNTLVKANGDGPITGLAVGLLNNDDLNQYLVIFKRRHITVYFQSIVGPSQDQQIDIPNVGCVSHKTIRVKDGNIYFLSDYGWRAIVNGNLAKNTLSEDVDDIFRVSGFTYGVNKQQLTNAFSTYYAEIDAYLTWVAEGSSTSFDKCYVRHMDIGEWMPQAFTRSKCAITGEDANNEETVYIGNEDGNIYKWSIRNEYADDITTQGFILDVDQLDVDLIQEESASSIPIFFLFNWQPNEDFDATYNFRDLIIEAIGDSTEEESTATVKAFLNFSRAEVYDYTYNFYRQEGFILDVSMLDVAVLGDDRQRIRMSSDINRTALNAMFGLYQTVFGAKLQILSYQLNFSKNGNRNT